MRKAIYPGIIAGANSFKASRCIALRSKRVALFIVKKGSVPDNQGERLNGIQEVSGSIPLISTKTRRVELREGFDSFTFCGAHTDNLHPHRLWVEVFLCFRPG